MKRCTKILNNLIRKDMFCYGKVLKYNSLNLCQQNCLYINILLIGLSAAPVYQ